MIGCPYCGIINRKGSNYCSNCGQRLDTVAIIHCPVCNAPNPSNSSLCAFCGTSLSPPVLAEGDVAGTRQPEESKPVDSRPAIESRPKVPPWLYEQPAEQFQESARFVESSASEERSKYLKGIRGVLPSADGWLASSISRHLTYRSRVQETPKPPGTGTR